MSVINISNIVNVSVSASPSGLAPYSINNLLCLTKDVPINAPSGGYAVYTSPVDVETDWGSGSLTYAAALAVFSQSPNIISGGGVFIVAPLVALETTAAAITRVAGLVYFGGVSYTYAPADDAEVLAACAVAQSLRKLLFVASSDASDLSGPSGLLFTIQGDTYTQTRTLFYTLSGSLEAFKWGYAGRAMSVNFAGSNTTSTMQLKQIAGASADTGITQTLYNNAATVGADIYPNVAGRSTLISNGANLFYDDVYNLNWFVGALEVAGFNYLAQTSTKVPQTEPGMDGLKGAYRQVCAQAVANSFVAPGTWTSADRFGNPQDFDRNILDFGYYIYSQPVALQSSADRALRKAPLVQVGVKFAGAIQTSDVIVYFNV